MTFLIINSIAQWVVILFILNTKYYLIPWIEFAWQRTFFGKVRYGFRIILWKKTGPTSASGKTLVKFYWVNPELLGDKPYCKPKSLWAKPWTTK